jgi:hypothetical protein
MMMDNYTRRPRGDFLHVPGSDAFFNPLETKTELRQYGFIVWDHWRDLPRPAADQRLALESMGRDHRIPVGGLPEVEAYFRRRDKLREWVEAGGTLLIPLRGEYPEADEMLEAITHDWPFDGISLRGTSGQGLIAAEGLDGTPDSYALRFDFELHGDELTPLYHISLADGRRGAVAVAVRHWVKGMIIYGPKTYPDSQIDDIKRHISDMARQALAARKGPLPEWTKSYALPREAELVDELNQAKEQIRAWTERAEGMLDRIEDAGRLKVLIAGTGKPLGAAIRQVLAELGATVSGEIGSRAEAVAVWKDSVAVLEVKGVTGGATEEHFRQIERWAREADDAVACVREGVVPEDDDLGLYIEAFEQIGLSVVDDRPTDAVGILVVATQINRPLDAREKGVHDFPPNMKTKLKGSRVVAVTGLQLLCLYLECRDDPSKANALLDRLFSGDGGVLDMPYDVSMLRRVSRTD